jgi:hypothetical protein
MLEVVFRVTQVPKSYSKSAWLTPTATASPPNHSPRLEFVLQMIIKLLRLCSMVGGSQPADEDYDDEKLESTMVP